MKHKENEEQRNSHLSCFQPCRSKAVTARFHLDAVEPRSCHAEGFLLLPCQRQTQILHRPQTQNLLALSNNNGLSMQF